MDFYEFYALVARLETVGIMIVITCLRQWSLFHLDVKSTILNRLVKEEVYVTQPPRFEIKGTKILVCRLKKAFHDLNQASQGWNKMIGFFLA